MLTRLEVHHVISDDVPHVNNFSDDKGNDMADVGSGEYFDARDVDDSEDNYGD